MCTHNHYIYNKYIGRRILVPCGKCEECLQNKADARAERIRRSFSAGEIGLFITLTYDNNHVPYVFKKDIKEHSTVTIYRGFSDSDRVSIGELYVSDLPYNFNSSLLPNLRNTSTKDKVGVCFYKDIQNFLKRFRINYFRTYGQYPAFKYYACTEYGETYYRPHAHLLFVIESKLEKAFRKIVVKSWQMCSQDRLCRSIEVARNSASYLSSYVNCSTGLPLLFKIPSFRQKHAYSLGFGCTGSTFSLSNLIEGVERNSLTYDIKDSKSFSGFTPVLIPKYVISRFFPKFKGYSRLAPSEVRNVLQRPSKLASLVGNADEWRNQDIHKIGVMLRNKAIMFYRELGLPLPDIYEDYAIMFERVWRCYASTQLKLFYSSIEKNYLEFGDSVLSNYDNINEVHLGVVRSDLSEHSDLVSYVNYNKLPSRVRHNKDKTNRFRVMYKRKKVVNQVMQFLRDDI